jgi:hypothetical protein
MEIGKPTTTTTIATTHGLSLTTFVIFCMNVSYDKSDKLGSSDTKWNFRKVSKLSERKKLKPLANHPFGVNLSTKHKSILESCSKGNMLGTSRDCSSYAPSFVAIKCSFFMFLRI